MSAHFISTVTGLALILSSACAGNAPFMPPAHAQDVRVEFKRMGRRIPVASVAIDDGSGHSSVSHWILVWADGTWSLNVPERPCRSSRCAQITARGFIDVTGQLVGFPPGVFAGARDVRLRRYRRVKVWIDGARL